MRRLLIFFAVGALLFGMKQALQAHVARPEPLALWLPHETPGERAKSIERALLAELALESGAALRDPVVRERLLTLLAPDLHDAPPSDDALRAAARELDLFHRDRLLETRLASNGALRIEARLPLSSPDDAALERYLRAHAERYQRSERFSFVQLFVSRGLDGEGRAKASALRRQLVEGHIGPADSAPYGEPCNLPRRVVQSSLTAITSRFGSRIAAALPTLARGTWSEPLDSTLGLHLIWPMAHEAAAPATLAEVRAKVLADYREEARVQAFGDALRALRRERPVQVHELTEAR